MGTFFPQAGRNITKITLECDYFSDFRKTTTEKKESPCRKINLSRLAPLILLILKSLPWVMDGIVRTHG